MAGKTAFLSFNQQVNPNLNNYAQPSGSEVEEMKNKDPKLRFTWTLWEQLQQSDSKASSYGDSTKAVASWSTVKEFLRFWGHLPQPSELLAGKKFIRETGSSSSLVDALMVFRDGIKPEWEDPTNATGGHFQFQFPMKPSLVHGTIDEYWNNLVMGMVGGTIEPAEMLTGVRLVDKLAQRQPSLRIEVWFANFDDSAKVNLLEDNVTKCMLNGLDGSKTANTWGKTEKKSHAPSKK